MRGRVARQPGSRRVALLLVRHPARAAQGRHVRDLDPLDVVHDEDASPGPLAVDRRDHDVVSVPEELLAKLEEKEAKITRKLEKEKDSVKRKRLKTELKIVAVQRKKGAQRREELNTKCD